MKLTHLGNEGNYSKYEADLRWDPNSHLFTWMVTKEEGFRNYSYDLIRDRLTFEASAKGCFLMSQRFPNLQFEERKVY
jgi:hypothetical protein